MIIIKISSVQTSKVIKQYTQNLEKYDTKNKVGQKADKVELTQESKSFSVAFKEAKESITKSQQENVEKAKDIETQIAQGTYSVSGHDVARKILFD